MAKLDPPAYKRYAGADFDEVTQVKPEPEWTLPMNRSELIARCEQLDAALREAKLQCGTWKRIAESGLGLTPETHADTNGVAPSLETSVYPYQEPSGLPAQTLNTPKIEGKS